jgi:glycosyltransferase involved in cell wall biosynthesis
LRRTLASHTCRERVSPSNEPLVSMVTPFYNTAEYLPECIESVLSQSYGNWEYLLVDNCSTDGSGSIAESYAANDPRIQCVHERDFVGQVENYNRALRRISPDSKYCKIAQADDWIYPRCLEEMVTAAELGQNVGLVSSFSLYGDLCCHGGLPIGQGPVYSGREAARAQLLGNALFGSPTCVMYLSEVVRSRATFFSTTTPYFEDTEVCFEILKDHDFGFVPQLLTFNRRDNDSIWQRLEERGYGPYILHEFMFVHRYGPEFLGQEEFNQRLRETEMRLYRLLAKGLLRRYGADFWQFHAKGLADAGQTISYPRVIRRCFSRVLQAVLNPGQTVHALWRGSEE